MEINRHLLIEFITFYWELNQDKIAKEFFNRNASKLSRPLTDKPDVLYEILFDYNDKNSAVNKYHKDKSDLLDEIKKYICENGCKEILETVWNSEYEIFIMKMLREIYISSMKEKSQNNKKKKRLDNDKSLQNNDAVKSQDNIESNYELNSQLVEITQKTPLSEQMLEIFKQAILDCYIVDFINSDPTILIVLDYVDGVDCFVKLIKEKIQRPFIHNQKEPLYIKISDFTAALNKYAYYLGYNMRHLDQNIDIFVPLYREENTKWELEFAKETTKQRKLINYLYGEVCDGDTLFVY